MATSKAASNFRETKDYTAGDMTLYNGVLYIFTSGHDAGAWDPDDVRAYDESEAEEVNRILAAIENTEAAIAFADSVVFEPQLISGDRYKYVLTN